MYIEIHDWKEFEQKVLYYKLNNSFNMNLTSELNHKIAGIYAIYKDDICLYVGQSKNTASRLATHLKGKYENCTNIYVWNIEDIGFGDFRERSKDGQSSILLNSEKYIMTLLKPIENLDIDMTFKVDDKERPNICLESNSTYCIQTDKYRIKIADIHYDIIEDILIDLSYLEYTKKIHSECFKKITTVLQDKDIVSFSERGYSNES